MASVANDPNGCKRLLFFWPSDRRHAVRLGKVSKNQGKAFKHHVEQLLGWRNIDHPPGAATAGWLVGLDDATHAKLAATGLVAERHSDRLGPWLEKYLGGRSLELKPEALRKLGQTRDKLLAFLGADVPLRAVTADQAADWRQSLVRAGLSEATVRTHSGNAKTIFANAMQRGLIEAVPFRHLRSGPTASKVNRYVAPEEAQAVIEALPNREWRLLFGLARWAGLRLPSEACLLAWAGVNWHDGLLHVRSPKTERHPGRESRHVPIAPPLMRLLQDRFDEAAEGDARILPPRGSGHRRRVVLAAIRRAGVEPWKGLFQTLRSSCEKQWIMAGLPEVVVSGFTGHSIAVSRRHYLVGELPLQPFIRAIVSGQTGAAHQAAQHTVESPRMAQQSGIPAETEIPHKLARRCNLSQVVAGQGDGGGGVSTPGRQPESHSARRADVKMTGCFVPLRAAGDCPAHPGVETPGYSSTRPARAEERAIQVRSV